MCLCTALPSLCLSTAVTTKIWLLSTRKHQSKRVSVMRSECIQNNRNLQVDAKAGKQVIHSSLISDSVSDQVSHVANYVTPSDIITFR